MMAVLSYDLRATLAEPSNSFKLLFFFYRCMECEQNKNYSRFFMCMKLHGGKGYESHATKHPVLGGGYFLSNPSLHATFPPSASLHWQHGCTSASHHRHHGWTLACACYPPSYFWHNQPQPPLPSSTTVMPQDKLEREHWGIGGHKRDSELPRADKGSASRWLPRVRSIE